MGVRRIHATDLAEALRGDLPGSAVSQGEPTSDFGGLAQSHPGAIVTVRSEEELGSVLEFARTRDVAVGMQGRGHSCGGQSLVDSAGILLHNRIKEDPVLLSDDEVELTSGLQWQEVEADLAQWGRSVPVTTDVLQLSVGGTLSVGGYGTDSVQLGGQIDHVTALKIITADGATHWCSPSSNPQLFRMALAGTGRVGYIVRVRMRTSAIHVQLRRATYHYDSLISLADSMAWLADPQTPAPPYLRARSDAPDREGRVSYGDYPYDEAIGQMPPRERLGTLEDVQSLLGQPQVIENRGLPRFYDHVNVNRWVAKLPNAYNLWTDFGFQYPAFRQFCEHIQRQSKDGAFGSALRAVHILGVSPSADDNDYFPFDLRPTGKGRTFTCGLYCMLPSADETDLARLRAAIDTCLQVTAELGGRPYVYGYDEMSRGMWERSFGQEAVAGLVKLREEHDPAGLIAAPWDRTTNSVSAPQRRIGA
ncbi:FAD-binding oxidoreductase [Actinomadura alba]|uniref:FAD-binding oxidoreductase n=1 Tax=Actinomadura alba TaxID=406431 RepID=A0ABR7LUH1_9ACTN|nr:FAD-binding oxidoreductase [Actinomadura alba]MBC6468420.1 FAD-binding oxidoreductase [Actinomadura alba]